MVCERDFWGSRAGLPEGQRRQACQPIIFIDFKLIFHVVIDTPLLIFKLPSNNTVGKHKYKHDLSVFTFGALGTFWSKKILKYLEKHNGGA